MKYICDYADERVKYRNKNGWCKHKQSYCDGNGDCFNVVDETDVPEEIDRKDICKNSSIFGNYYIELTDEQIDNLKSGKVYGLLHEEYNIFVGKK